MSDPLDILGNEAALLAEAIERGPVTVQGTFFHGTAPIWTAKAEYKHVLRHGDYLMTGAGGDPASALRDLIALLRPEVDKRREQFVKLGLLKP